jgi:antitoxin ParD1/3/4
MTEAVKVTVTLNEQIQDFVRDEVEEGAFASTDDYIQTVLRQRQEYKLARQRLDAELQKGLDDIRAGRVMSIDEAFDSVYQELGLKRPVR